MILEKGDMWDVWGKTDFFCITTNSYIKANGQLAMGKGIALEANVRFPNLAKSAGTQLILDDVNHLGYYGATYVDINTYNDVSVGIMLFQTKYHFNDTSSLTLIKKSLNSLFWWLVEYPDSRFDLNFPGIGYGGLNRETVLPYLKLLPDNVHIWEL